VKEACCRTLSRLSLHVRHYSHLDKATSDVAEPCLIIEGGIVEEASWSFARPLVEEIPRQREGRKTGAHSRKGVKLKGEK